MASMNKFHTMFLTSEGQVYGCGHEIGGRLGLETDSSIIIPRKLKKLHSFIVSIATGMNHTLFLTDGGQVSCQKFIRILPVFFTHLNKNLIFFYNLVFLSSSSQKNVHF